MVKRKDDDEQTMMADVYTLNLEAYYKYKKRKGGLSEVHLWLQKYMP